MVHIRRFGAVKLHVGVAVRRGRAHTYKGAFVYKPTIGYAQTVGRGGSHVCCRSAPACKASSAASVFWPLVVPVSALLAAAPNGSSRGRCIGFVLGRQEALTADGSVRELGGTAIQTQGD